VDSPVLPESNPPLRLLIEPLNLGPDVRAISLDLAEEGAESHAVGPEALAIWNAAVPALVADESWTLDFVSHLDRVREFCSSKSISWREAGARCITIAHPDTDQLESLFERFETETFGFRVRKTRVEGTARASKESNDLEDAELENDLSKGGMDAYHGAFTRYTLCAICDFENGSIVLITEKLSSSEVLRRLRPFVTALGALVDRPE
jgi:predicted secreted protein